MRTVLRTVAVALTAAVVLPLSPAASSAAPQAAATASRATVHGSSVPPKVAATPTGRAAYAAWAVRDARAWATVAHLARREARRAKVAARSAAPARRDRLVAAASFAARDAGAKSTIASLAAQRAKRAQAAARADRTKAARAGSTRAAASSRASRSTRRTAVSSTWDRLAQCEAGGNWSINTGNGYYGGLQFSLSSWRAAGGSGYPHKASREEQIRRGEALQARQGWGAWPSCSRKLGLR